MSERPVRTISFSVIQHYTESREKVLKAILTLIPDRLTERYSKNVSISSYKGFHGNIITRIELIVDKRRDSTDVFTHIVCSLSPGERVLLVNSISERRDSSGNLYIRFSKQDAYMGYIRLAEGDETIRVVVKPVHPRVDWGKVIRGLCGETL